MDKLLLLPSLICFQPQRYYSLLLSYLCSEFLKLNPIGFVPMLIDGDSTIVDSLAIIMEATTIGRTFASMKDYQLDGNKEMMALGTMNIVGLMESLIGAVGAVTAGNATVLKPSKCSPACSSLLASNLSTYLDNTTIKVIKGGP
ncbi:hypothetical protein JHK87_004443 [Glycine soja]|nr:hypothetical protein JHK87_004443 [Glycine soja]